MPIIHHYFTYRGRRSLDFQAFISGAGTFNAPQRDVDTFEVPGRSGALLIDNGRFKNVKLEYDAYITKDFERNMTALRSFLLAEYGYFKLEDTYHPNEYRMAAYSGPLEPDVYYARHGSFTMQFDCMPQRWLKSGDIAAKVDAGETVKIWNPTPFTALPVIQVAGTGTFSINSEVVTITTNSGATIIDCERQECYEGTTNRNGDVSFAASKFPSLVAGENTIAAGAGVYLQIMPKWWTV